MTIRDGFQVLLLFGFLILLSPWLGRLIAKVMEFPDRFRLKEMSARHYLRAVLIFNAVGFVFLFALQMAQNFLPLNPSHLGAPSWHLAFNTAVSFVTNTNWQSYAGETTYSRLIQMMGFGVQNFLSAATGLAVLVALARALRVRTAEGPASVGNFWRDLTRATVFVLLPLATVFSIFLVSQGVVQTFAPDLQITTVEGAPQTIPVGPAASQIAIKQLGTNGGGYFNANAAHPVENPTPLSNFFQCLALVLIPGALVFTFGHILGKPREARILFGTMTALLFAGVVFSLWAEFSPNLVLGPSANLEGKELRFGVANSAVWSVFTTAASNGAVNAMHASLSPLAGLVALFNMMLGEIIFGGVGSGLYGMLLFVLLTVFLAGLMVGRSPEYLGRKIEAFEIKMVLIGLLAPSATVLVLSAIACANDFGLSSVLNKGPHGLTEILYAFTSAANNNGSAFAGLNANTPFYNVALGLAMLVGRFAVIIPVMLIAGSFAEKKVTPPSLGTFRTDSLLFAVLLIGTILVVGGLTFFPALSLGPIVEHLMMLSGKSV